MSYNGFKNDVLKVVGSHKFKVTNSNGTKEAWRWIKKNKWLDIGQPITEREFGQIVKAINSSFQDQLLQGKDITLPHRMGRIEIRKFNTTIRFENSKLITNLPINWKSTLKLWYEDEEAYRKKSLIRHESKEIFTIYYNKNLALFKNKTFYKFIPTRAFKIKLKQKVLNRDIDALLLGRKHELH